MDGSVSGGALVEASVSVAELIIANTIILILIACSAVMAASEIAYFSLSNSEIDRLRESEDEIDNRVAKLLEKPRYLLSTIVVTNNLVNIGVVITSYFVTRGVFDLWQLPDTVFLGPVTIPRSAIEFTWNVVVVTFLLVLFGEATPKVYATQNKLRIARFMSGAFVLFNRFYKPLNYLLVSSTRNLEKRLKRYNTEIDIEEINKAIEITVEKKESKQDARLLKGIVYFGNITVKQIMRPRLEVAAVNKDLSFRQLMDYVRENAYSRYPVYEDSLDTVVGVLNVKDLLAHTEEQETFEWQTMIREPFFVPETKKIDDLLREIQVNRKHLAVVVDEFGGTSGIITLEDIIEEVLGDIKDEFDETTDSNNKKIDDRTFLFDGKTPLMDVCRLMEINTETFDNIRSDAESLAGLLLELVGRIPKNGEEIKYLQFRFTVISVINNRIDKVKVVNGP